MKKRKLKKGLMKFGKTFITVLLLVSLNINPIAMGATLILETGIVDKFSNLGKNLVYLAGQKLEEVRATEVEGVIPTEPSGPTEVSIVETPDSYFSTTEDYLKWIKIYTQMVGDASMDTSLLSTIRELYQIGSGYSSSVKIDADSPEYKDYGKSLAVHDEALTARLLGVNERDLSHINAAQIEQLMQMGYDPRWVNKNGTIEEDMDKILGSLHEYSVANVYSLNNMIGGALWRPYSDEIPYIQEFAEIVGGFANVYMGYWDTNVSTLKQPINSQRALEILGYDAILRYEGIQVLEPTKMLENGIEAIFVPEVVGLQKYTESPVQRTITTDPDVHVEDIPDRDLNISGQGGVPTGQGGVNENIILRQVEVDANGTKKYVKEDDIQAAIVPDSTMVQLYQEEIPNVDITWLDAVTVLYKALGKEQISYQTFTAFNPNITPETSPLSKDLPGLTDFDGYNFYAFFTRSNPYSGDMATGSFQAIYWRKAVNDGFVSYALRDQVISAEDFYMLAKRMMEAYGEPEMSADEMHTLLQIYGSYYPVQLGRTVADAWEYLKCRGILTEENQPESFTSSLTRDQLLDICMRIKDKDSRINYKNMNLTIDVGEVLRDKDYFPVYDFDLKTEGDDAYTFISTTVDYLSYDNYTYMFPVERAVTLGNSGCGLIYNKPEKSNENLIDLALYEGKKHIEGYDYYVIDVPKEYTGPIFLGFQNYDDPGSVNGTVDFIEVPNYCLGGGIYTAYEIHEENGVKIATLVKPEEGVSYFPFSSQSNNMDLVYYCDIDRCEKERPVGSEPATTASLLDKIVDKWNYLTQPMEVLAAEKFDESLATSFSNGPTLETEVSINPNYWKQASDTYGDGDSITIRDTSKNMEIRQIALNAPGWMSALLRASLLYDIDFVAWRKGTNYPIGISDAGKAARDQNQSINGGNTSESDASIGRNIVDAVNSHKGPLYSAVKEVQSASNGASTGRVSLIAFAAGINPRDIRSIEGDYKSADDSLDPDVEKAFKYLYDKNPKWLAHINSFNSVSNWGHTSVPGGYSAVGYTMGIRTSYIETDKGGKFNIESQGYDASDILDKLGSAGTSGSESGVVGGEIPDVFEISTSLNTSAIMDKNKQILLCWDDMVKAGFAWGLVDGKPKMSDDNTYTFMTKNGMVKVNDHYHMIQIGTTLYTWPSEGANDTIPNLVFVDDDKNMYFDIRCVTGIINVPVTELEGKAKILHNSYGTGNYAIYSISTEGAQTSLYETRTLSCYNFPEIPGILGQGTAAGSAFPVPINTLEITAFDGEPTGVDDKKYWEGEEHPMRVLLADFHPTANWLLTVVGEEGVFQGKLYVYYLKDAFLTDTFSDGESPPDPTTEWEQYWVDDIEVQKKRCETNYDSLTYSIQEAMVSYRENLEDADGENKWIADMTEAAMYSIAADTGTFRLSNDYAVRCFDLTANSVVTQPENTDFTQPVLPTEDFRSNEVGTAYFMDYAGYIYNIPKYEDFTLTDYLSGKFLIPLVNKDDREIWNMNMTWYGNANTISGDGAVNTESVPYGCELTDDGFIDYKTLQPIIEASRLPLRYSTNSTTSQGTEDTSTPFYIPPNGDKGDSSFKPAPTAMYARYGILDTGIQEDAINMLNQNETIRNYYYLGNRTVCISDEFKSRDATLIPFDFASTKYNPICIPSVTTAHFAGQVRRPMARSYYVILYTQIYEVKSALVNNSDEEHLATDDSYLWEGKAKLVSVLNMIDRSTNWLMWAVFSLAPMICVIVMTILIGISFITDNKIWLLFCEKFFDPVRILTLGMKDSEHWNWRYVWKRAIVTYIAFALFANANILKLVIWAVDGWMRISEALGF